MPGGSGAESRKLLELNSVYPFSILPRGVFQGRFKNGSEQGRGQLVPAENIFKS